MKLRVLELFAGIGAVSKALKNLGHDIEIVDAVEIDKYAIKSFNAIHGTNFEPQDITKWDKDIKDIDILTHGSPCFRKGELVNTQDGMKKIEDIKIGDIVKTATGKYRKVIRTFTTNSANLIDIKPSCSHLINTTENHPFYVLRDGKYQWVNAGKLTTKDYLCVPVNNKKSKIKWDGVELCYNKHHETSKKLPFNKTQFWYIIGRFVGDGWVNRRRERNNNISGIKICCGKHEIKDLIRKIGDVFNYCIVEERTVYKIQIVSKELGCFCERFGVGAKNKHIPQDILDIDKKYLLPLYNGIMESDGCFSNGIYKVSSISKQLVYNIGELELKLFGYPYQIYKTIRPKKCVIEGRVVNQNNTYTITWRKPNKKRQQINFVKNGIYHSRVRKINRVEGQDIVYNLEVEKEHTYCVNNIATHNCQDYSIAGLQAGGDEGSGTRSSLMYESIRIIDKLKPKYVLWENVKNLLSKKHKPNFNNYINRMEQIGYKSYYKVLNAKDYGIPQNRERVFTVSIRKDINKTFTFPEPIELKLHLKDMLEDNVDDKYFISDKLKVCYNNGGGGYDRQKMFYEGMNRDEARTITTRADRPECNYIKKDFMQ